MRKHKPHSKSAGALDGPAPFRLRQPGYGAHPALAKKLDRLSDDLQQTGSWVLSGSEQDKPPLEPATAWGTIKVPQSPSGAVLKSWPKWAKPGFLDEVPPRLEGCRQRLLAAERELRRAEAGGALSAGQSPVAGQEASRKVQEVQLPPQIAVDAVQLPVDIDFEELADPAQEEEELLAQLSSLESQMNELDKNWEAVSGDHTVIRSKRNDFSDRLKNSQAREANLKWRLSTAASQLEASREEIQSLRGQLGVSESSSDDLKQQLELANNQVSGLQKELNTARSAAEEFRDKFMASEEEQGRLQSRIADLEETNETLRTGAENRVEELEEERRQVEETLYNERQVNEDKLRQLTQETDERLQKLTQENDERVQKLADDLELAKNEARRSQKLADDLELAKKEAELESSEALRSQPAATEDAESQTDPISDWVENGGARPELLDSNVQKTVTSAAASVVDADAQTATPLLEENAAQTDDSGSVDTAGNVDAAGVGAAAGEGGAVSVAAATLNAADGTDAHTESALPEEAAAQTAPTAAESVIQAPDASKEQQWVDAWEKASDALNLAAVPPLLMASGLLGVGDDASLLCPARCRLDLDLLEMVLQPLRPAGPLERIPLSKLAGIDYFECDENLGEHLDIEGGEQEGQRAARRGRLDGSMVVQLELEGEHKGKNLQLIAGDEWATEALFTALRREDRTMPGGLLAV